MSDNPQNKPPAAEPGVDWELIETVVPDENHVPVVPAPTRTPPPDCGSGGTHISPELDVAVVTRT